MLIADLFKDPLLGAKYSADGYVIMPLLNAQDLQMINTLFGSNESEAGIDAGFYTSIWSSNESYRRDVDKGLKQILMPKLESYFRNIKPVFANYMVKASGPDSSCISHQDWSFVEEPTYDTATVWCPLIDVDNNNGNLQVIAGSHKLDNFVRGRFFDAPFRHIDDSELQAFLTHVPMQAGNALVINSRLIHASPPNMSGRTRLAASVVIAPEPAPLYHWTLDNQFNPVKSRRLKITSDFFGEHSCYESLDLLSGDDEQPYVHPYISRENLAALLKKNDKK